MEVTFAAVSAYDDNHKILSIETEKGETIVTGQEIKLMLTDESYVQCQVAAMRRWKIEPGAKRGKWIEVTVLKNGEHGEIDVYGVKGAIQTTSMPSPEERRRRAKLINLMPYKELNGGGESILDHVDINFRVPDKVIAYLQTTNPYMVTMGIYKHPFKNMELLGPYWYTDDEYIWERDTWKYVLKYHVTLPQVFIDKVMSEAGTEFLNKFAESDESWSKTIRGWKTRENMLCLMPDDAGDRLLEDF